MQDAALFSWFTLYYGRHIFMAQLGPWEGHRRARFVVAAFSLFGVLGGSAGMAATSSRAPGVATVMVPAVDPLPSVRPVATAVQPVLPRQSPVVVVTTREVVRVVKVYVPVTPTSLPKPSKAKPAPKPVPVPTSGHPDVLVGIPEPLPTAPATTVQAAPTDAPSAAVTPFGTPS